MNKIDYENQVWRVHDACCLEPRLLEVQRVADNVGRMTNVDDRWDNYSWIKSMMKPLVGFYAKEPRLRNHLAYQLFLQDIVERMRI